MINIPGYKINEKVFEASKIAIYSGWDESNKPVLIETLNGENPDINDITRLRKAYEITSKIDHLEGIIHAIDFVYYDNNASFIFEYVDGIPLQFYIKQQKIELGLFLNLAIQITDTLSKIHENNIIHGNLNTITIAVLMNTEFSDEFKQVPEVRISGFGRYALKKYLSSLDTDSLQISPEYISPEQTGRIDREVDYRSDLYSLGVVLYEMITGRVPFQTADVAELIHCHIAKEPIKPSKISDDIPETISNIIMKLLSKDVEDRYQSAKYLKSDLEFCRHEIISSNGNNNISLENRPTSDSFFPDDLYGRDKEEKVVIDCLNNVRSGATELLLISGEAGIGKTFLVDKIFQKIKSAEGFCVKGKYDPVMRERPYYAIIQSFRFLIEDLLKKGDTEIDIWRKRLIESLQPNAGVITDIIPELELIIGKQPSIADVGGLETRNRFNSYFLRMVKTFSDWGNPLIIFLDDLHWADDASIEMIKNLITDIDIKYLLIIGAYRENEIDPSHPLVKHILKNEEQNSSLKKLDLSPLEMPDINNFISDSLHCSQIKAGKLSEYIYQKTKGNPFFVKEFLGNLFTNNILFYDEKDGWDWDLKELYDIIVTENVINILKDKIGSLVPDENEVITIASCIGNQFDLTVLSKVYGKTENKTQQILSKLSKYGLLVKQDKSTYRFIHDRIQETVLLLLDEEKKADIYYRIGNYLLNKTRNVESSNSIFVITDQLNRSGEITNKQEDWRQKIIWLNLMAGKKAKSSAAFHTSLTYLRNSYDLIKDYIDYSNENFANDNSQVENYDLLFSVIEELAEVEYLNGNYSESEELINNSMPFMKTNLERAKLYNILILQYTMSGNISEAVLSGKRILEILGARISEDIEWTFIEEEINKIRQYYLDGKYDNISQLLEMKDPEKILSVRILKNLIPASYNHDKNLFFSVITQIINISNDNGIIPEVSIGFNGFGNLLGALLGDFEAAHNFGELSLEISRLNNCKTEECENCHHFANFIMPWTRPVNEVERINKLAIKAGLESGELKYTGYAYAHTNTNKFFLGVNINEILSEIDVGINYNKKTNNLVAQSLIDMTVAVFRFYSGETRSYNYHDFLNNEFNEDHYLEILNNNEYNTTLCQYYLYRTQLAYLHDDFNEAIICAEKAGKVVENYIGGILTSYLNFYQSLSLAALYGNASETEKKEYLQQIQANQMVMKQWADSCRENYYHKYLLVEAEIARIKGEELKAIDLYDNSISAAHESGFFQNDAIACELAAKFWLDKGKTDFSKIYIERSLYGYKNWGAVTKVRQFENKYSEVLYPQEGHLSKIDKIHYDPSRISSNLDHETIMKASYILASEIDIERLLERLNEVALQNSGARRFLLILEKNGKFFIESETSIDNKNSRILNSIPLDDYDSLPLSIIKHVIETGEDVVINNIDFYGLFAKDPYLIREKPKSLLCTKRKSGNTTVIGYLENNLAGGVFTRSKIETLKIISMQAVISLENARLYREKDIALNKLQELNKLKDRLISRYDESMYENLQDRIDPHFMFNAINTIHSYLHRDVKMADDAIIILADIYHFLIDRSFDLLIPFIDEWKFLEDYLNFERLRYPDNLTYEINKSGDFGDVFIPPLTIQPVVENLIKQGIRRTAVPGCVKITAERDKGDVNIKVFDSGTGLRTDNIFIRKLETIKDRLKFYYENSDVYFREQGEEGALINIYINLLSGKENEPGKFLSINN